MGALLKAVQGAKAQIKAKNAKGSGARAGGALKKVVGKAKGKMTKGKPTGAGGIAKRKQLAVKRASKGTKGRGLFK